MTKFLTAVTSFALASGLAISGGITMPPAYAAAGQSQSETYARANGATFDQVQANIKISTSTSNCDDALIQQNISHWVGIESFASGSFLVQAGYGWKNTGLSFNPQLSFFWEWVDGSPVGGTGAVDRTSQVLGAFNESQSQVIGHRINVFLWYYNTTTWSVKFTDLDDTQPGGTYYFEHTTLSNHNDPYWDNANDWIQDEVLVADEKDTGNLLVDDGTQAYSSAEGRTGGVWNWFWNLYPKGTEDMINLHNTTLETAGAFSSTTFYAYHVHQNCGP